MIACFDVQYFPDFARGAALLFHDWHDMEPHSSVVVEVEQYGEYEPGKFYQRELQPLLALLPQIPAEVSYFLIDAYCFLDAEGRPGLGSYLHSFLPEGAVTIGIAKNRYQKTIHAAEVIRGGSKRPLFVTSIGIDYLTAGKLIQQMAGEFRIPKMLKAVDHLARFGQLQ
ncbi:MAG: endonuclease V [Zavarzinella sp.]